jgi:ribonuclease P protein component
MLPKRYTFRKQEHLHLKKQIDHVFSDGRWLRSHYLRFLYLEVEQDEPAPARILFSVPKKLHRTAVKRNLLRRRMRESYRLHKPVLYAALNSSGKKLWMAFIYNTEEVADYKTIDREIKYLLAQLISRIEKPFANL